MNRTNLLLLPVLALPLVVACGGEVPAAPRAEVQAASPTSEPSAPSASAEPLTIDAAASHVNFVAAKITATHEGGFRDVSGTIALDPADLTRSRIEMRVATASIFADSDRLTDHLKSPDFFDVARFPEATFRSTSIVAGGANGATHTLTGELAMHGQTKSVSFPATVTVAADAVSARAEFTINRRDFGIVYPGMPDDLIKDDVVLRIDLRAPRAAR